LIVGDGRKRKRTATNLTFFAIPSTHWLPWRRGLISVCLCVVMQILQHDADIAAFHRLAVDPAMKVERRSPGN
jgi:hypothetical protein